MTPHNTRTTFPYSVGARILARRILVIDTELKIIKEHPLKGVGLGSFSLKESRYSHNSYLQIWAETGIIGFMLWLVIVFLFLKKFFLAKNKTYNIAIFCAGLTFLIHNLIDFSFFISGVSFLWWVVLGLDEAI